MGKLVLGIVAVIFLQIAFSIYLAMESGNETAVKADRSSIASTNANPDTYAALADNSHYSNRTNASAAVGGGKQRLVEDLIGVKSDERYTTRTAIGGKQKRRPYLFVGTRASALRGGGPSNEPQIKREYFGSTVVEVRFEVSENRGQKTPRSKVRREVFGKMIVEHKFAI